MKSLRMVGRGLLYLLGIVIILALLSLGAGYIYELSAKGKAIEKYPPPGQMVSTGEHQLHLYDTGQGDITVIIEAGSGSWSMDWMAVQTELSKYARVITYDRAGYGWSEEPKTPRTGEQIVKELHTVLDRAGIEGPYILVGHSLGGLYAQLFTSEFSDEVAGLVLVDPRPVGMDGIIASINPEKQQEMSKILKQTYKLGAFLSRFGIQRFIGERFAEGYPEEYIDQYIQIGFETDFFNTVVEEIDYVDELEETLTDQSYLSNLPLTVISHGVPTDHTGYGFTAEENAAIERAWQDAQKKLARQSEQGKYVVAEDSGHIIMLDQPEIIIEEILNMVEQIR
ncbi:MAG: alpha/beta hydrolase [Bacillaceae bacterium]|nr:alpha/beta hydrolase [Bacillaceae bacterium]